MRKKMKIRNQVTSLEPSKELEKLGMKQDSLWYWVEHYKSGTNKIIWSLYQNDEDDIVNKHVSAPTFAELLEVLPDRITTIISKTYSVEENYFLFITKTKKTKWFVLPDYYIGYKTLDDKYLHSERADTIADAAGKMVIYLIKKE